MIRVLPHGEHDDPVTQHPHEIVVYELPLSAWNEGLRRVTDVKVSVTIEKGSPVLVRALPDRPGSPSQLIQVTGGSIRGRYEIVRLASDGVERRRRSFKLRTV